MAIYNEILEGRFNRGLQKLFATKGGPPVRQLGAEIMPVIAMFNGVENRFLEGWNRYSINNFSAAVVGQRSCIALSNPADNPGFSTFNSKVIVVVEKILLFNSGAAADTPAFGYRTSRLAGLVAAGNQPFALDARSSVQTFRQGSVLIAETGVTAVALPFLVHQVGLAINAQIDLIVSGDHELPLLPGDSLFYQSGILNQQIQWSVIWRERPMTESERQ